MLICETHWSQMIDKVKELGMSHLATHDANDAARYFVRLLKADVGMPGDPIHNDDWDPLVTMNFNYMKRVLLTLGWIDGCPLCIVRGDFDTHNTPSGRCGEENCDIRVSPDEEPWDLQWINDCAEVLCEEAKRRGLMRLS